MTVSVHDEDDAAASPPGVQNNSGTVELFHCTTPGGGPGAALAFATGCALELEDEEEPPVTLAHTGAPVTGTGRREPSSAPPVTMLPASSWRTGAGGGGARLLLEEEDADA